VQLITAVVAPDRIGAVLRGLRGFGRIGWNLSTAYELDGGPVSLVRLDLVAANADTADVVRVIVRAAAPAVPHVWVTPVDHIVRIRSGELGPDAVE
jgi:nitrogen regulatory protein P-II 1